MDPNGLRMSICYDHSMLATLSRSFSISHSIFFYSLSMFHSLSKVTSDEVKVQPKERPNLHIYSNFIIILELSERHSHPCSISLLTVSMLTILNARKMFIACFSYFFFSLLCLFALFATMCVYGFVWVVMPLTIENGKRKEIFTFDWQRIGLREWRIRPVVYPFDRTLNGIVENVRENRAKLREAKRKEKEKRYKEIWWEKTIWHWEKRAISLNITFNPIEFVHNALTRFTISNEYTKHAYKHTCEHSSVRIYSHILKTRCKWKLDLFIAQAK